MICNKCGSNEPDYALYCTKCGAKLEAEAPLEPYLDAASQPESAASPYAAYGAQPGADSANAAGSPYTAPTNTPYTGQNASANADRDWMALLSMICGIASLPFCCTCWGGALLGAAGIVFGILGIHTSKSSYAIAGIVCGAVGALLSLILMALFFGMASFYDSSKYVEHFIEQLPGINL